MVRSIAVWRKKTIAISSRNSSAGSSHCGWNARLFGTSELQTDGAEHRDHDRDPRLVGGPAQPGRLLQRRIGEPLQVGRDVRQALVDRLRVHEVVRRVRPGLAHFGNCHRRHCVAIMGFEVLP